MGMVPGTRQAGRGPSGSTHRVKRTPQTWQAKGFSPVCVRMWRGSLPAPWMTLWQTGHSWGICERRLRTSLSGVSSPGASDSWCSELRYAIRSGSMVSSSEAASSGDKGGW